MSWNATGTATVHRKIGGEGFGVRVEFPNQYPQNGHGVEESKKAMAMAQDTARIILESGTLGTGAFNVQLSGHANPNNEPSSGWANDGVTISIQQRWNESA